MGCLLSAIATILIPYYGKHELIVKRAVASAYAQSVFCDVVAELSPGTPAHVRNLPLTRDIRTPFVVFLDADDYLSQDFVEECLRTYERGHYVYTGYTMGAKTVTPPAANPFWNNCHLVTTLFPTEAFKALGGFDLTLPGYEDTDLYLRAHMQGICGVLNPKPLVHYTADGQRSETFAALKEADTIREMVLSRNGGKATLMGCCGEPGLPFEGDPGQPQPGDVLAIALWSGIRDEIDLSRTRKIRGGNGSKVFVDRATAEAYPQKYQIIGDAKSLTPDKGDVLRQAGLTE